MISYLHTHINTFIFIHDNNFNNTTNITKITTTKVLIIITTITTVLIFSYLGSQPSPERHLQSWGSSLTRPQHQAQNSNWETSATTKSQSPHPPCPHRAIALPAALIWQPSSHTARQQHHYSHHLPTANRQREKETVEKETVEKERGKEGETRATQLPPGEPRQPPSSNVVYN